jgi:hypothetical protein
MDINKYTKPIVFGVMLVFAGFIIFLLTRNNDDLKVDGRLTTGQVIKVYRGARSGMNIDYVFYVDGRRFENSTFYFIGIGHKSLFENKTFPVIYLPGHPDRNRLLIEKSNFDEMGLPFPDSLQWVTKLHI